MLCAHSLQADLLPLLRSLAVGASPGAQGRSHTRMEDGHQFLAVSGFVDGINKVLLDASQAA